MGRVLVIAAGIGLVVGVAALATPYARRPSCSGELFTRSLGVVTCDRRVFATTPKGRSWRDITPPRIPGTPYRGSIYDAVFLDARNGWALTNECAAGRAAVHRTHDGGRSWMSRAVEGTGCSLLNGVRLVALDDRHAWLDYRSAGLNGWLMATTDGGKSWTGVGALPFPGVVRFRTPREGWLAHRWGGAGIQQLHETRDGGRTWRRRVLIPPRGWSGARIYPDLPTFFGKRGVLPATMVRRGSAGVAFYGSEDGGRTWRAQAVRRVDFPVLRGYPATVWYVATSIAEENSWWVAGGRSRPLVLVTADAGRTWRRFPRSGLPRSRWWAISAVSGTRAWLTISSWRSALFATDDGGRSWRRWPRVN
jgi:photosystem II stability/assembly factor-like uncharacterized protein